MCECKIWNVEPGRKRTSGNRRLEQREGKANQFPNISEVMRSGRGEVGYEEDDEVKNERVDR
ncbi:hypothetical protein E2C01_080121 [Portunus trituberculatus]|uniref:Uncharacterized protein n=1 Tax=Portunus trituberculatus TaxID=210409 RepID=A0A5B7IIP9_PORTR|nr:hypothetical protein [Portunus trituberculatus]